jgi:hypothetical protein
MSYEKPTAPHMDRCVCATFNKTFAAGDAILFGTHCQACKTGGLMIEIVPVKVEDRIEEKVGSLKLTGCTRCNNRQWAYFNPNLEHSDKRNFDEANVWTR